MTSQVLSARLYEACRWTYRLAVLNVAWLVFSCAGLIVAGVFPATAAMFGVARGWMLDGGDEQPVLAAFWRRYRSDLLPANRLGYAMLLAGAVLYVDIRFFHSRPGLPSLIALIVSLAVFVVYACTWIYLFPVYAHLNARWHEQMKVAAVIAVSHPLRTVLAAGSAVSLYFVFTRVPGLAVFFGVSVCASFVSWQTMQIFAKSRERVGGAS